VNASLYGTLGGSVTSVSSRAEPLPPGSFLGPARELAELLAELSNLTAGHSRPFLPSRERFLIIFAGFKCHSLLANVRSGATVGRVYGIVV